MKSAPAKRIVKNSKPSKKLPIRNHKFEIPQQYLSVLDEFSGGGYCLIILNEFGVPQVYNSFDTPGHALAVTKFCKEYFEEMDSRFSQTIKGHASHEDL